MRDNTGMQLVLPQPFSALIFDCDGTLVDTAPAHFQALRRALAAQGHAMERDWYLGRTGLTPRALLDAHEARLAAEHRGGDLAPRPLDRPAYNAAYNRFYQSSLGVLQEITVVADLARTWHGRVPLAVASNGHSANVAESLRATGLLPLFDQLVTADDVSAGKPAPDVFLEAARRMGVEPATCVVLEDSNEGLAGARAAGMRAVDIREYLAPKG